MKKLIAILTIAIVLVGAVFADPTVAGSQAANGDAKIVVKATIEEDFPAFALKVKSGATIEGGAVDVSTTEVTTANSPIAVINDDSTLTTNNGSASVVFSIIQKDKSVTTAHYQFGVVVSNLVLVKTVDGAINRSLDAAISAADTDTETFGVVAANPAIAAVGASDTTFQVISVNEVTTNNTSALKIKYTGNPFNVAAAETEIATFTAAWNANVNAKAGEYQATVTLSVTAI